MAGIMKWMKMSHFLLQICTLWFDSFVGHSLSIGIFTVKHAEIQFTFLNDLYIFMSNSLNLVHKNLNKIY